jgi:LysM repeat protein
MRLLFFSLLALCTSALAAQSPQAVNAYVERYKAIAIEEMKTYGIPASVTLAQGIHESGCGCSALALNSNNHFGIKCHEEWSGQTYHHDDDQPQECFRVYSCPEESFRDHSEFLKSRPRYATLFSLDPTDYRAWARGLKAAGYATNPKYTEIIINLIETYNLTQFDKPLSKKEIAKAEAKNNSEVDMIKQSLIQSTSQLPAAPASVTEPAAHPKTIDIAKSASDEKIVNGVKAIIYKNDAPVAFIAQKYNLTVQQLYSFNDLASTEKFKENDLIYLENKKQECATTQYEVQNGETMRDISQKFAVQLSALTKRNEIPMGCEPVAGELVVLRGKREVPLKFKVTDKATQGKASVETEKVHTVESNETLYSISRQYNIPIDTLKKINGLGDEGNIRIGQTLIVDL